MWEQLGIPEWLAVTLGVGSALAISLVYGYWSLRRAHERVAARRTSPDKMQFLALMETECSPEAALFLWEKPLFYIEPRLSPHPDDDLLLDLKIDDDDIAIDWPRDWARQRGFHESNLPDWPKEWPTTIRNFGRWLNAGPQ